MMLPPAANRLASSPMSICNGGAGPCPLRPEVCGTERPLQNLRASIRVGFVEAARFWGGHLFAFTRAKAGHYRDRLRFRTARKPDYNCINMPRISRKSRTAVPEISFTAHVWKEGPTFVSYSPELDVSSCGDSVAEARARLREAVCMFLEECSRRGTLEAILAESGFEKRGQSYRPRRIITRAKFRLAVPLAS